MLNILNTYAFKLLVLDDVLSMKYAINFFMDCFREMQMIWSGENICQLLTMCT